MSRLGRKSSKLARNAALKLAQELFSMMKRPEFAVITSCLQGTESQLFKSVFRDWDDVIAVDYTRTAESVSKTGADLSKWMSVQKVKIDLASLFTQIPEALTEEEGVCCKFYRKFRVPTFSKLNIVNYVLPYCTTGYVYNI
jgi:hypothetical protein